MTRHLLALETSSNICDVAVLSLIHGTVRVYRATNDETGRHAECLLPLVDQVLEQAGICRQDLGAIAFGQGPGGFTGLRVATGVAQGMAFGLGVPVIPISSLLAVAVRASQEDRSQRHLPGSRYLVVQDARMGEVYFAVYESPAGSAAHSPERFANAGWRTLQEPILIDATHIHSWLEQHSADWEPAPADAVYIVGDALDVYPFLGGPDWHGLGVRRAGAWRADAQTIGHLALAAWHRGDVLDAGQAVPLYVRDKVAFTTAERQRGAGGNPRAPAHDITIHPMTPSHLDAVAAIEARVQAFPWTRRNFADGLAAGYPGWVACQNDQVIGFYMVMMAPDVAHLLVIAIDPDYQGRGAGKRLLDHCQEQAMDQGLDTMVLEVRVSNLGAIGFYKHQGFHAFTARKDYYPAPHGTREDASVMKKSWPLPKVQV